MDALTSALAVIAVVILLLIVGFAIVALATVAGFFIALEKADNEETTNYEE